MIRELLITGCATVLLSGCSQDGVEPPPESPEVAVVGGAPISQALFDAFVKERTGSTADQVSPALKKSLLKELKQLKAASLAGEKIANADFEHELELKSLELLAQRVAMAAGVDDPPTDTHLQQAYETFVTSLPANEYHMAHIHSSGHPPTVSASS